MRFSIIFTLLLSIGCSEKDRSDDNTNNSNLTAEFCESIQDRDTCNQAGCVAIRTTFSIVDGLGNCTKKLFHGNMCVYGIRYTSNNCQDSIYYKNISSGISIGFEDCGFSQLFGWTKLSVLADYCCRMDPEGCAETPWVDATDHWFPFEGLLD